jgi:hypothetical protein
LYIQAAIRASFSAIQYIEAFVWSVVMVSIMKPQVLRHEYSSLFGYNLRTPFLCDMITCHLVSLLEFSKEEIAFFFLRLSRSRCFRPFKMKKAFFSETSGIYYAVTWCHIAEERSPQPHRRKNPTSCSVCPVPGVSLL